MQAIHSHTKHILLLVYILVELPFHFEVVKKTATQMVAVNCLDCGFFSEEGAGREFSFVKTIKIIEYSSMISIVFLVYVYFWSRVPFLTCKTMDEGITEVEACGIPSGSLYAFDQSNCENICTTC